jgi:hypothetical protein
MQMNYRWEAVWAKLHEADISLQIQLGECIGGLAQGEMHLLAGSKKLFTPRYLPSWRPPDRNREKRTKSELETCFGLLPSTDKASILVLKPLPRRRGVFSALIGDYLRVASGIAQLRGE